MPCFLTCEIVKWSIPNPLALRSRSWKFRDPPHVGTKATRNIDVFDMNAIGPFI